MTTFWTEQYSKKINLINSLYLVSLDSYCSIMSKSSIHFNISERKILLRIFDAFFVLLSLYFVSYQFDFDYFTVTSENWNWVIVLLIYLMVFGTVFELYDLQKSSRWELVLTNILITTSVTVMFYLLTPFFTPFLPVKRLHILYFFLSILAGLITWRLIYINFISSPRFYKNVIIIGEVSNIGFVIDTFRQVDPNYHISGFINSEVIGSDKLKYKGVKEYTPKELLLVIKEKKISEIVIANYNSESITPDLYRDLIALLESGFSIKEYTQVFEEMTNRVPVQFVGRDFYKYFPFSRSNQNKLYQLYSRVFDIVFSLIGIILTIFFIPFIFLINLIANKGNLFYTQERVGKNGEIFRIVKFRTMIKNAENGDTAVWAKKNDSRVTPFGKFLRLTRLDEFPQVINILKGEMSVIGPRPERPYFVRELSQVIPFYETRHIIKPGLTGWAQVNVRYGSSVEDSLLKLQYDLFYIKHRSFFLDVNIMVKTLSTMLFFRGQ